MNSSQLRQLFIDLLQMRGHTLLPPASLVPEGDSSVLFTTAGMQQFKAYYSDPALSSFKRICTIQPSLRTNDIDEVGDETHLTLFEMLGFFSFGYRGTDATESGSEPYFKEIGIKLAYDFFWNTLKIDANRLHVTVFPGRPDVPADEESVKIWQSLGLTTDQIKFDDNFWGPTGEEGPCGPSTEIYIDDLECGNVVFNQYYKHQDGKLTELEYQGVDTGLGFERIYLIIQGKQNIYDTDLFAPLIEQIKLKADLDKYTVRSARIIADHLKAAIFLIADGVRPSNKAHGYILRRLIRRSIAHAQLIGFPLVAIGELVEIIYKLYSNDYDRLVAEYGLINLVLKEEIDKFEKTLKIGLVELEKSIAKNPTKLPDETVFQLFDTFGFPLELTEDLAVKAGSSIDRVAFYNRFKAHQELSRAGQQMVFKGGLADHEPATIRHHTAHHLLLSALRQVLGEHVFQRGSNVNGERLRIDFSHSEKILPEQLKQIESIVNEAIVKNLTVKQETMPKSEAEKLGALAEFGSKYSDTVTVYTIYNQDGSVFSREFCGGPHVNQTGELGLFSIIKEESSSAGVRRIKAKTN